MLYFLAMQLIISFPLQVDWTLNIGEQALDICIVSFIQSASSVFVLGERNFFCLKDNGQIRFMKKLDYSPSCFLPYCSGVQKDFLLSFPYVVTMLYTPEKAQVTHIYFKELGKQFYTEHVMEILAFKV